MNTKSPTRRIMIAETASSSGSGSNGSDTADCSSSTSKSPNNVIELDKMIQVVGDVGYMKQQQEQQEEANKEIAETTVAVKTILSENSNSCTFDDKKKDVELILDLNMPSMDDAISSSIHDKPKRFQLLPINKNKEQQQWTKDSTSILQLPHISPSSSSSVVSSSSKSSTFKQILKSSLNVVTKQITMKTKQRLSTSLSVYDNEEEEDNDEHSEKEGPAIRTRANTKESAATRTNEENVDVFYMIQHEQWDKILSYVSTLEGIESINKCQLLHDSHQTTDNSVEQVNENNGNSFNLLQLALMYNPPMEFIQLLKDVEPNLIIQTRNNNNTNKQTPLHIACSWGVSSDIIQFLIDWSFSLSSTTSQILLLQKDLNGNIPLHLLCGVSWPHLQQQQEQQKELDNEATATAVQNFNSCIQLLIKYCPQSVSVMNNDGIMPLQYLPPIVASEWICYSLKEQVFVAKKAMFVKQVML